MTKCIQIFWKDVSHGENIDLYVAVLAAFTVTVTNLFADFGAWITSLILFVLGDLAVAALVNRHQLRDLTQRFGAQNTPPLRRRKALARLPEHAEEAKDVLIIACSASSVLYDTDFFINKIKQGTRVRLAVVDPRAYAVIGSIGRSNILLTETQRTAMSTASGLMKRIMIEVDNSDLFEIRVFNYVPTLSFVMIDGDTPIGSIIVEMYPYQTDPGRRPHLLVTARDHPDWYIDFRNICEAIWRDASPSPLHSLTSQ